MNKKFRILTSAAILSAFLLAVGSSDEETKPEKVEQIESSEEVKDEVAQDIFKVGETVKMKEFEFTVNSVRFDNGSEFTKPDEGMTYLVLDATIKNIGDKPTTISSMAMFDLIDAESYKKDEAIFADTKGRLGGELGQGRDMRGEIAFKVGLDEKEWEFIFEPGMFSKGQAIYKITLDDVQ